jgi:hypothetical protein
MNNICSTEFNPPIVFPGIPDHASFFIRQGDDGVLRIGANYLGNDYYSLQAGDGSLMLGDNGALGAPGMSVFQFGVADGGSFDFVYHFNTYSFDETAMAHLQALASSGTLEIDLTLSAGTFLKNQNGNAVFDSLGNIALDVGCALSDHNGHQLITEQQPAVANATGAGDVVARLNDLLACLRTHGLIAT